MPKNLVIVGSTGAVGKEMLKCLEQRKFPIASLKLISSPSSVGKKIETAWGEKEVEGLGAEVFEGMDIALFATSNELSKEWAPLAAKAGCLVIDNSSAFRYEQGIPLVIPEINSEEAEKHNGIIANPNCTTAIASIPLWKIHQRYGLRKVIMSTYQAVSGAGKEGLDELLKQTESFVQGNPLEIKTFQHQILFNLIPHIDKFQDNGYTKEEMKVVWETRKIFGDESINISCTSVRVPILRAHSMAVTVETDQPISPEEVSKLFEQSLGIKLIDDIGNNKYPMPLNASEKYDVQVGRIRQSLVFGNKGLDFFVSGDQLLKGAALNAVQIAELFV
jgi:aspartate-semialdehyde dehydrogenase